MEQIIPRERFEGVDQLEVGMQFQAGTEQGPVTVRVTKVEGDSVTVDGNHPLAGKHLNFAVTITEVRGRYREELTQNSDNSGGGCCGGSGGEGGGCCNDPAEESATGAKS